jgi:hypothetical protein
MDMYTTESVGIVAAKADIGMAAMIATTNANNAAGN